MKDLFNKVGNGIRAVAKPMTLNGWLLPFFFIPLAFTAAADGGASLAAGFKMFYGMAPGEGVSHLAEKLVEGYGHIGTATLDAAHAFS